MNQDVLSGLLPAFLWLPILAAAAALLLRRCLLYTSPSPRDRG